MDLLLGRDINLLPFVVRFSDGSTWKFFGYQSIIALRSRLGEVMMTVIPYITLRFNDIPTNYRSFTYVWLYLNGFNSSLEGYSWDDKIYIYYYLVATGVSFDTPVVQQWITSLFMHTEPPNYAHPKAMEYKTILSHVMQMIPSTFVVAEIAKRESYRNVSLILAHPSKFNPIKYEDSDIELIYRLDKHERRYMSGCSILDIFSTTSGPNAIIGAILMSNLAEDIHLFKDDIIITCNYLRQAVGDPITLTMQSVENSIENISKEIDDMGIENRITLVCPKSLVMLLGSLYPPEERIDIQMVPSGKINNIVVPILPILTKQEFFVGRNKDVFYGHLLVMTSRSPLMDFTTSLEGKKYILVDEEIRDKNAFLYVWYYLNGMEDVKTSDNKPLWDHVVNPITVWNYID